MCLLMLQPVLMAALVPTRVGMVTTNIQMNRFLSMSRRGSCVSSRPLLMNSPHARSTMLCMEMNASSLQTTIASLVVFAGAMFLALQWLYKYLTAILVGPRPRGGISAFEASDLERLSYMPPRDEPWTLEELRKYDGSGDGQKGPILLAAGGLVFNVGKARNFYGPKGEYHIMAGRDASRFLAKTITEEESGEEAMQPLSMAERAVLAAWVFSFKQKYVKALQAQA